MSSMSSLFGTELNKFAHTRLAAWFESHFVRNLKSRFLFQLDLNKESDIYIVGLSRKQVRNTVNAIVDNNKIRYRCDFVMFNSSVLHSYSQLYQRNLA